MATASAWWMVDLLTYLTAAPSHIADTIRFQTTLRPSEKQKTSHTKATIIMFDIVFILLFGRLQPHKHPTHPTRPSLWEFGCRLSLIYLCIRIGIIILHDSISGAIDSLPLILFQTICMFGCLVLYFKMLRTASDPKYRQMIYWVLGILSGLILSLLSEKLFYLTALFIYSFFGRTIS